MKRIPLRDRRHRVVAHALVDDADFEWLNLHRWSRRRDGRTGGVYRTEYPSGRTIIMSREIMGLGPGDLRVVDHSDRDTLNNQRFNLRVVPSNAENNQNLGSYRGSSSRHRGVSWHQRQRKWVARCRLHGKLHWLGSFDDEAEAARVASDWRRQHMPYALEDD